MRTKEPAADEAMAEVRFCLRTRSMATSPASVTGRGLCREMRRDGAVPGLSTGQLPGITSVSPAAVREGSRVISPAWTSSARRAATASAEALAGSPQAAAMRGSTSCSARISCGAAL